MGVNLAGYNARMTQCLLDGEDVRGATVKDCGESVSKRVWVNLLGDAELGAPLTQASLDLSGGDPVEALADNKRRKFRHMNHLLNGSKLSQNGL